MDTSEVRVKNLADVIGNPGKHGEVAKFARKYDLDPTFIRQILSGHRNMGERAARNFEEKLGLDKGSLDRAENKDAAISARFENAAHLARTLSAEDQDFLAAVIEQYVKKQSR